VSDHTWQIRYDGLPGARSPNGRQWIGHYYKCQWCGLEIGHPNHLTSEQIECPVGAWA